MANNKLMISHAHADRDLAHALSILLTRCSLQQIACWYSSDPREGGGIGAGQRWFEKVREELITSRAIVVLLTENSVQSSWVQFESGFGAASAELEIIPLVVNLDDMTQVPNPISHWQIFDLKSRENAKTFVNEVLSAFDIHFDDELANISIKPLFELIKNGQGRARDPEPNAINLSDKAGLTRYLDKKFFDLHQAVTGNYANFVSYDVEIANDVFGGPIILTIEPETTFQDVMNEVYWAIEPHVLAYTYMDAWMIVNETSKRVLAIREVAEQVPAHCVMKAGDSYRVITLSKPYKTSAVATHPDFQSSFPH